MCRCFFFRQKSAYKLQRGLVGSEMCMRDRFYCRAMKKPEERIVGVRMAGTYTNLPLIKSAGRLKSRSRELVQTGALQVGHLCARLGVCILTLQGVLQGLWECEKWILLQNFHRFSDPKKKLEIFFSISFWKSTKIFFDISKFSIRKISKIKKIRQTHRQRFTHFLSGTPRVGREHNSPSGNNFIVCVTNRVRRR